MDLGTTLYASTRAAWRAWLAAHHESALEIWLVSYRKHTGQSSVPYNDAVEEALCFCWIDSTRKDLDETRYAHRYSPRRAGSSYSQTNKERLARLADQGLLTPSAEADLAANRPEAYVIPEDIRIALQARDGAWAFFQSTSPSYQRIRAAYVDHARKRPDAFEKRLANLVQKCVQGKAFGYGIDAYY
ncbi:MAG: YdeI/OmpD-associated family protein [Bacteroidota bacterium]